MEHGAEPTPRPPGDPSGEAPDTEAPDTDAEAGGADRDLGALEALERELASLEGELDRVERAGAARPAPEGEAASEPPS